VKTKESNVKKILALTSTIAALSLAACGGSSDPVPEKVVVGTATAGSFTVKLLADAALGTGGNAVHAQVTTTSTGVAVTDLSVTIVPMMDMGTMMHSCPVTGPLEYDAADGLYSTGVIFQMPGNWTAKVSLARPGMTTAVADFAFPVADARSSATFTVGMTRYVLSYNYVNPKVVGLNAVVLALYGSTDMGMTFTPVNDATFEMVPWMPSMGHGASGSVQPTLLADGVYQGKVMFSMPGDWDVTVKVTLSGASTPAASPVFSTIF
jgi:hypothetical protein